MITLALRRKRQRIVRPGSHRWRFAVLNRCWEGQDVYILGGGPSLAQVDVRRLMGRNVIAINMAYRLAPWFPVIYLADPKLFLRWQSELSGYPGTVLTTAGPLRGRRDVLALRHDHKRFGLSTKQEEVYWNRSSGACAIDIAAHLGARRVILFGYDMRRVDGRSNWHDYYQTDNDDTYALFRQPFAKIAADLRVQGIECINATPGSALTCFPIVEPGDVLPAPMQTAVSVRRATAPRRVAEVAA